MFIQMIKKDFIYRYKQYIWLGYESTMMKIDLIEMLI